MSANNQRVVTTDWLKQLHRDLDACQKVIWLGLDGADPSYCRDAQARLKEIDALLAQPEQAAQPPADHEAVLADHRRLVRELDVLLNGEDGAAQQASLCDLVAQVRREGIKAGEPLAVAVQERAEFTPEQRTQWWAELRTIIDEYVDGYEFRGDDGDYSPNERERILIEDCVAGLIDELPLLKPWESVPSHHEQPAPVPTIDMDRMLYAYKLLPPDLQKKLSINMLAELRKAMNLTFIPTPDTSARPLSPETIHETVAKLRAVPGNGWNDVADPYAALDEIRNGPQSPEADHDPAL